MKTYREKPLELLVLQISNRGATTSINLFDNSGYTLPAGVTITGQAGTYNSILQSILGQKPILIKYFKMTDPTPITGFGASGYATQFNNTFKYCKSEITGTKKVLSTSPSASKSMFAKNIANVLDIPLGKGWLIDVEHFITYTINSYTTVTFNMWYKSYDVDFKNIIGGKDYLS